MSSSPPIAMKNTAVSSCPPWRFSCLFFICNPTMLWRKCLWRHSNVVLFFAEALVIIVVVVYSILLFLISRFCYRRVAVVCLISNCSLIASLFVWFLRFAIFLWDNYIVVVLRLFFSLFFFFSCLYLGVQHHHKGV